MTVECKFSVSYTYYVMYWYRQPSSGEMIYVINIYSQNKHSREGRYSVEFTNPTKCWNSPSQPWRWVTRPSISVLSESSTVRVVTGSALQKPPGLSTRQPPAPGEDNPQNRKREDTGTMVRTAGSRERLMNVLKTTFPHLVSEKEPWLRDPSLQSILISVSGVYI